MPLEIKGLSELRERLERLRVEEVMARALAEQAGRMAAAARDTLSDPPGAGGHDQPWLQSGALRDSMGAEADGLQAAVGSSDPAAVPQETGTARTPPRPFLAPVAAGMGEEVARAVAGAVVAALKGEPEDGAVILAGTSASGRPHGVPYHNPLGVFRPGSPENEDWTRNTMRRLQELGHILRSERQDGEGRDDEGVEIPDLPANPDDLLQQGWEEITHPDAAAEGHRTFKNKETGLIIRADKGEPGQPGDRGRDHYHIENSNTTSKRDEYLDKSGRPVGRGSKPSHILPGDKP